LERNAINAASNHGIWFQGRPELVHKRVGGLAIFLDQRVEGIGILIDHVFAYEVGRHDHRSRGPAGFDRRAGLKVGVVVAPGVDRGDLEIRVLGVEAVDQFPHLVGQHPLDWHGEE
jgi:hypothetical protein